jgi:polysaccharide export outer membrane protein
MQQAFTPAPAEPYGYVPLRTSQPSQQPMPAAGGYYPGAGSSYGTQVAANPTAYYASPVYGQGVDYGYILGAGDKVRVSVYGEEDLTGEYQIDGSGNVQLPLIGTLRAAGSTAPGLQAAIAGGLAQGYLKNPRVSVEITTYRPFYIIGSVNRPGQYAYVNNMSALDAVAMGGGFTDKARDSVIYVRHEGSTHEDEMTASQVTRIYPGDVVRVKTTLFWDAMDAFAPIAGPAAIAAAAIQ